MISIALATYNGAQYLEEQLNSYIDQTRKPDEIVVCDDCSTDGTLSVLKNFRKKAPFPVKINQNLTNKGTVASFANAVNGCSGDFIFFSDHDDVWLENKIEVMMRAFEGDPSVGLVFCDAEVVDENLNSLDCKFWESVWFDKSSQDKVRNGEAFSVFLNHIVVAGMSAAFRAEYRPLVLPMPDLSDGYDGWVALLIAAVANIALVDRCLVHYRVHGGNQVGVRTLSFWEQLRIGVQQLQNDTFPNLLNFRKEILKRLDDPKIRNTYKINESLVETVRESIGHLETRMKLHGNKLMRLVPVISETFKGNYFKYSYGIKSVAQDLFLK